MLAPAGWLFSELALVLVIIVLGGNENSAPATPRATPVPTPSGLAGAGPGAGSGSAVGLNVHSVKFVVHVAPDAAGAVVVREFRRQLAGNGLRNARVGIALLFGVSWSSDALAGTQVSKRLATLLRRAALPQLVGTEVRTYLGSRHSAGGDRQPGDVDVELFVVTG
jgi:hypothetical protein